MMDVDYVTLNNGYKIPIVGLGTNPPTDPEEFRNSLRSALDTGYRHIDTAFSYKNEDLIGEVLQEYFKSGKLKREDVFITSKLWPAYHEADRVHVCLERSLEKLQLEYVDLYLDHFPAAFQELREGKHKRPIFQDVQIEETWRAMEDLVKRGKAKSIGVSNYNMSQLRRICDIAEIMPVVNQVECHLYLQQEQMREYLEESGIKMVAYSPLGAPQVQVEGKPTVLKDHVVREIAIKYNRSIAQIMLRYQVQRSIIVVPNSSNPERQRSNLQIFDFELSRDDMDRLACQDQRLRYNTCESFCKHPEYPFIESTQD